MDAELGNLQLPAGQNLRNCIRIPTMLIPNLENTFKRLEIFD